MEFSNSFSPRAGRTRVQSRDRPATLQLSYPPASRGREWNFTIPLLRVRDARGYNPENNQRISSIRTRPRLAGVSGVLQFLFSACGDARGYGLENYRQISSISTRPRLAGVNGILQFLFSACEDARGYSPENHQRITSLRTRPRPAGVNGVLQFLFLRVRGRTRVQSSEPPANHLLPYPPASRVRSSRPCR